MDKGIIDMKEKIKFKIFFMNIVQKHCVENGCPELRRLVRKRHLFSQKKLYNTQSSPIKSGGDIGIF